MGFQRLSAVGVALLMLSGCQASSAVKERAICPALSTKALSKFNDSALPDPFTFTDGSKVRNLLEWECRREEISKLFQLDELGTLPPRPEQFSATFVNNTLTITAGNNGTSITFTPTIRFPTTGTGPFPAFIGLDGGSIPYPDGVAVISFNTGDMAQQNTAASRGIGKFYDLFGTDATASAMMAWSWAISRIIDALEVTPSANIDVSRIGVTGCSRDGKGALVAGAFDPRIVLTIPQESGSGGTDCWRLSDYLFANGLVTQTASEIVQENVWFSLSFENFANTTVKTLPVDHHFLASLVAPRGLLVIDNIGYDWLGAWSSWGCMNAGKRVFTSLGATENMGISQAANHTHCQFPAEQQPILDAFINKFLLKTPANTTVDETAGNATFPASWQPWKAPFLFP